MQEQQIPVECKIHPVMKKINWWHFTAPLAEELSRCSDSQILKSANKWGTSGSWHIQRFKMTILNLNGTGFFYMNKMQIFHSFILFTYLQGILFLFRTGCHSIVVMAYTHLIFTDLRTVSITNHSDTWSWLSKFKTTPFLELKILNEKHTETVSKNEQ